MTPTKVKLVFAEINECKDRKEYIAIENETGVLLVEEGLFVISFNSVEEIPYYEPIAHLASVSDKTIVIHRH